MPISGQAYITIVRIWTLDLHNEQDICAVVGGEVFEDLSDAMHTASKDMGKQNHEQSTRPQWNKDTEGNNFIQYEFNDITHAGEQCKRIARWEIHPLYIRPITH